MLPHKVKLALKVLIHKTLGPNVKMVSDEQFNAILFRLIFSIPGRLMSMYVPENCGMMLLSCGSSPINMRRGNMSEGLWATSISMSATACLTAMRTSTSMHYRLVSRFAAPTAPAITWW